METQEKIKLNSYFVTVNGSRMHYYDIGSGDPIVFVHGIPTCAYLWRHIIPVLSECGRCIAPDLIGMGQSDKPDIEYSVFDHIAYFEAFIDALKLKNITLVLHGWGSIIGFDYARRHEKNVKAIAFYEAYVKPITHWNQLSLPVQQFATLLNRPGASYRAVIQQNYLIERILPRSVIRELTAEEMNHYRAPFPTPESRKPLWQYVNELPLGASKKNIQELMQQSSAFLQKTKIPKLMLYAIPGFMTTVEMVNWASEHFPNIELAALDDAMHLAQETVPKQFSDALMTWYDNI